MKAVLVGTMGSEHKLYYLIDAEDKEHDGVISDGKNPKMVNFWKTSIRLSNLKPIKSTSFHKFLWDGDDPNGYDEDRWNRIFVNKTQKIPEYLLSGVSIVSDVLKSNMKSKSINHRISEFKVLLETQNTAIVRGKYKSTPKFDI